MIKIYSAETPLDAQLIRGLLNHEGIEAVVQGESLWTVRGELPFTTETSPSVWVREENAERARELIDEHQQTKNPAACGGCGYDLSGLRGPVCPECGWAFSKPEPWVCPTCGEKNEGQFSECWKCAGDGEAL
ncbi:MAG: DUF2007 domain-containing protein [Phycisphaerales bacterium]|nr:DUF2007 domain-containing protein [Phycisphaerales bacterium]